MNKECFVCRKHSGEILVPGGVIYQDNQIYISHSQIQEKEKNHYLGHLFIEPKRHVPDISNLTDEEAKAIGLFTTRVANALIQTQGMEHIYSFVIGDGVPHVHVHVIGRYPGAPKEYWGTKVDDWPNAPKGGENEITTVVNRIRDYLSSKYVQ
jgi:histidine triad (HIT) family protein